jgi:hypothetical protein
MAMEAGKVFNSVTNHPCPYLYRSFLKYFENQPEGAEALKSIFDWESRLIAGKIIKPIGIRIFGKA